MDSRNPNPPSMRVLTRPPARTPTPTPTSGPGPGPGPGSIPASSPDPQPSSQPHSGFPEGVVVVGFISRGPDQSSHIINRVLDSNTFGSGHLDKTLFVDKEEVKGLFRKRRISYYHEEEKGLLLLQFSSTRCPVLDSFPDFGPGLDELEFEELQGLLFMFSVCHVIIYIQEGSRFDTHVLKKFRVLQASKNALIPYVRSRATPLSLSRPHSSLSSSRPTASTGPSPGRNGGFVSRNASSISLMSGLGSYASLFPGHCTPVMLFVFVDDFLDGANPGSNVEESSDNSLLNQSSSLSNVARPNNMPTKGSGSVVVLARPVSKSEGGFRKKLQSSFEAQIRFLIKKCRTLSGSESGQGGSRSGVFSCSAPLFSLDASRSVVLLDRSTNQRGESLEFAIDLVEDVLSGKATSDSLLLESHSQNTNKEDFLSIKDFIYRQSDVLRGKGGLVTGTNSGSAAGVGMVAVAAAAAAASASSGKTFTTLELPSLEIWLSSSQVILNGILTAKRGCTDETEVGKRKPRQQNTGSAQVEGVALRGMDPLDVAVSLLENGRGLNTKFSTLWCERSLPAAKDVYLKDLPACYPTSQHEAHLDRALYAFLSMVRGPAVQLFVKKLEDECTSIWKSGRQLCDAVSLTGKPCMHQRHDADASELHTGAVVKPHSSGYFFLHACACGRSRQLRSDPFDFESANISSNCFTDCDKLLPVIQLPEGSNTGPIQSSSWKLLRIGGSKYYEPSKGLLQSGFSTKQKFLSKWTIFLEKPTNPKGLPDRNLQQGSVTRSSIDPRVEPRADKDEKKTGAIRFYSGDIETGVVNQRKLLDNKKTSSGRGFPNFTMRKPFSEVVAGSSGTDSGFPPLQQRKQHSSGSEKGMKESWARDGSVERFHANVDQESQKSEDGLSAQETLNGIASNGDTDGSPFLQIGSYVVPMSVRGGEVVKMSSPLKHAIVYVGFEHECPYGHRFLLDVDHLNELGSPYSLLEESHVPSVVMSDNNLADPLNLGKSGGHGKVHRRSKGMTVAAANKVRNMDKSKEMGKKVNLYSNGLEKEQKQTSLNVPTYIDVTKYHGANFLSVSLDDGGSTFSLLNRNIPVYMNCPYCRLSRNKKDSPNIKYAGTVSQLQRIFLVTPPCPLVLAACPVVKFEASCLPPSVLDREQKLQFSLGCQVVLPPDSFLSLRLPFVYGVQLEDGNQHPLNAFENKPEMTAWIIKGTTLQVVSKGSSLSEGCHG